MKFLFRTDASINIGSGHLMRCLTLADQLRCNGGEVAFICRDLSGSMFDVLQARGYQSSRLSWTDERMEPQLRDAEETIRAAQDLFSDKPDWLVVDHYQLEARWEAALRPYVCKIMAIDDLANRQHDCDILLDQNYESVDRYRERVTRQCRLLLGPSFALLRPEYAAYRMSMRPRDNVPQKVLIFFGGTDQPDMTGLSLEVLSQSEFRHLKVDIVVGSNYQHRSKLNMQAALRPNTVIYGSRPHLADLMARADLAIGAGGVTNWERMCLGLPSLVIAIAENQVPISELLHEEGAIRYLGRAETVTTKIIENALAEEIGMQLYEQRAKIAKSKCDGQGVSRVVNALLAMH
ncbi:MAG: UDP-2,4-diacetamido-2,4,6-trideoxy-beta-L-altropyranose hydrolase [Gallionella sp.]